MKNKVPSTKSLSPNRGYMKQVIFRETPRMDRVKSKASPGVLPTMGTICEPSTWALRAGPFNPGSREYQRPQRVLHASVSPWPHR